MVYKKPVVIFFVWIVILISGACSQSIIDEPMASGDLEVNTQQEITIWHTYSDEETEVFENIVIPLFEKEHPLINIIPVRHAHSEQLRSAIISRASSNKPPDIIRMDIAWLPLFAELKLLYPVSEFQDFHPVTKALAEIPLQSNYYDGKYYGIPLNTNTRVSVFNRSLLDQSGLNQLPETMEEVFSIAEKNGYKIGIPGLTSWEFLPYFYSFGGKLLDETNTHAMGYLNSQESMNALNKLVAYYQKGILSEKLLTRNVNTWQGILDETYFMIDEGPWFYSVQSEEQLRTINDLTVHAPFPVKNGIGSVLGGENLVITKGTKHVEAAWTFLKWMVQEEPQQYMLQTGLLPTNKNVQVSELFDLYPFYETYSKSIEQSFLRPPVAKWNQVDSIFEKYMTSIFSGNISVEEGLTAAAQQIEQILQEKEEGS